MAAEPDDALELEVRIAARAQTIFRFLTDPGEMTRWMGTSVTRAPRPGGVYRVNVTGEYLDGHPCQPGGLRLGLGGAR